VSNGVGPRIGDIPYLDGYETVSVRGADEAYATFGSSTLFNPDDPDDTFEVTQGQAVMFRAGAAVRVGFEFAAGPAGVQMARDVIASIDLTGVDASAGTLPDGDHFVQLYNINSFTGRLVIEPAEWLGTGRSRDCGPAHLQGTTDDVTEYCVGRVSPRQFIEYSATEFTVAGPPPHAVEASEFGVLVDTIVWDASRPQATPMLGWVTVAHGKVVAFEEVSRQGS
jgi:hypothetical protein